MMKAGGFDISEELWNLACDVEIGLAEVFRLIDKVGEGNQLKVLRAMQNNRLGELHFAATNGYGYNDMGRDAVDRIFAQVFGCETALVRPGIVSGTHALASALFGNLRSGDELLAPAGRPHITLEPVIGLQKARGSLAEYGVKYKEVGLLPSGSQSRIDFQGIRGAISPRTRLAHIQRSKGYAWRNALSMAEVGELVAYIKSVKSDVICMVDNCYGEFTEATEPTDHGADLVVGSLIKNPGGGLVHTGGYIAGKAEFVEGAAFRLTAPGIGGEVGPSLGFVPQFMQGFFFAPSVVAASLKTAVFTAAIFEKLGYDTCPRWGEPRADIVQAIRLNSPGEVSAYCQGVQKAAPVDSYLKPEPWGMPGYDSDIIMASGAFVQGSGIEFGADATMKPPYTVYQQGALTWWHGKIATLIAVDTMQKYMKKS